MSINKLYDKTAGYKTRTGAVLLALYTLIESVAPSLLTGQAESIVRSGIDLLIITGGADWVWRNRNKIIDFLKNILTKKEK
jgi:hypothetical protein